MEREQKVIKEEDQEHLKWFKEAHDSIKTPEQLTEFMDRVMNGYRHDYGTVCHAMSACALAACWVANAMPQGGITGFQAGFVMWSFIREWLHIKDTPLRLLQYRDMLFPQNDDKFEKTITKDVWEFLQEEAAKELKQERSLEAADRVREHWQSIVDGKVPFGYTVVER